LTVSLLEPADLLWPGDTTPYSVRLAARSAQDGPDERAPRERRAYARQRDAELQWVRAARLSLGQGVSLVDLSAGGALLDSPVPLRPNSVLGLEIVGAGVFTVVQFRVLRCEVGGLQPERTTYRGACEFTRILDLPGVQPTSGLRGPSAPIAFVGLDLALKHLVDRVGPAGDAGSLSSAEILEALQALLARAAKQQSDPFGEQLGALLAQVVPALEQRTGLSSILAGIENQLRRSVPQATLRMTAPGDAAAESGVKSIVISMPGSGTGSPIVSIDLPRGLVVNDWQSRLLRTASRLIALLQRLDAGRIEMPIAVGPPATQPAASVPAAPEPEPSEATGWQKIVVRYVEGQILKGYTQDFHAGRQQFSLWPAINSPASERVIVPLARLKGVFFVRNFAGDPTYVERTEPGLPANGRRIEVTLIDDEVLLGSTLNYRADGNGFFVIPADPRANNIRVFVVASAVRQVRFP
jgi:hypothetical protein